jgi:hypothetical protein
MYSHFHPRGVENTALVESISVAIVSAPIVPDGGFESPIQNSSPYYTNNPSGTPWTFLNGNSGVSANASSISSSNPPAPQGNQAAYLESNGGITQTISGWSAGSYQLNFHAAQMNNGVSNQELQVYIDGTLLMDIVPGSTDWENYASVSFSTSAGSHTIKIIGLGTSVSDVALIDQISISLA